MEITEFKTKMLQLLSRDASDASDPLGDDEVFWEVAGGLFDAVVDARVEARSDAYTAAARHGYAAAQEYRDADRRAQLLTQGLADDLRLELGWTV